MIGTLSGASGTIQFSESYLRRCELAQFSLSKLQRVKTTRCSCKSWLQVQPGTISAVSRKGGKVYGTRMIHDVAQAPHRDSNPELTIRADNPLNCTMSTSIKYQCLDGRREVLVYIIQHGSSTSSALSIGTESAATSVERTVCIKQASNPAAAVAEI